MAENKGVTPSGTEKKITPVKNKKASVADAPANSFEIDGITYQFKKAHGFKVKMDADGEMRQLTVTEALADEAVLRYLVEIGAGFIRVV